VSAGESQVIRQPGLECIPNVREGLHKYRCLFLREEQAVSPLVLILVVILVLSLLGGGYGFRSGNTVLGAGGGLIGLILVVLLILALLGRI
jgi:hypothetical protein